MFHFINDCSSNLTLNQCRHIIKRTFDNYSTAKNKNILYKTDFKCAWLYLFGYKISKVEYFSINPKNFLPKCNLKFFLSLIFFYL